MPRLLLEATRSRSGKHAARRIAVIVEPGRVRVVEKGSSPAKGTYVKGTASYAELDPPKGGYIVYMVLVRGLRGRVTGRIHVYDHHGRLVLEAKLVKRKIRRVRGDARLSWVVEAAVNSVGLSAYVKRYNWATGE